MSYRHLIALFAPLAFALPAAAAQSWSPEAKAMFVQECVKGAQAGHSEEKLTAFCDCAATKVSQEFSEAEMADMSKQVPPDPALQKRLMTASSSCNTQLQ
ncbi:hypothetical protein D16iCDA_10220 [Pseudomonas seleniipraecipitans]|jgi:hypothetical protein|uniref:Uncharacterized protein n=1 Tax=Phytopseudomonas seleniipraecipitans TaxID=640205 RepID=A0A1G7PLB0_9GAMM|nr:hypothetical protein [Pseudomonas seleniipraecipitans]UUD65988.1 hypothetical protein D16iCDA_10220 [Pseudomonas seleniipraecipitans]SDF87202.1 hypothetical protein SAMN05216381_2598 [Pseudomonas seleniipraecipitans]